MKFLKNKKIIITCMVCLLPILFGVSVWDKLPDTMAIHFNIEGEPDNFASKSFVVFGLPVFMALFQLFCCLTTAVNMKKYGGNKKFESVTMWIIPVLTVVLYGVTLGYGMGWNVDIRKTAMLIVGGVFLAMGSFLPGLDYVKNRNMSREKAKKINRFTGFGMIIMGVLAVITAFLPPVAAVVWLCLLIPFIITLVFYGIFAK